MTNTRRFPHGLVRFRYEGAALLIVLAVTTGSYLLHAFQQHGGRFINSTLSSDHRGFISHRNVYKAAVLLLGSLINQKREFECLLAQIKAELTSLGRLNPGHQPGQGVTLIISAELPAGWIGIDDDKGCQAFGPASDILIFIKSYVRELLSEGTSFSFRPESLWPLMIGLPQVPPTE